jgi:2,4-dienoyl-CoA reductase-like NADH-dependent reductase (Old Yellow Enzyme family)
MGMPLQETLDTFRYFISEADKLGLAYISLVRYTQVEDGKERATPHDVLESYRSSITKSKLLINGGVTPEEGESLVSSGKVDGVVIGFQFITHPDLVKRVLHGKPLDNVPDFPHLSWKNEVDMRIGYTDYPVVAA